MFDRSFLLAYGAVKRRKKLALWSVIVISLLALLGVFFVSYESSIDLMFPNDPDIRRSIDFLRDSKLSDKVVVSLALVDPTKGKNDLFRAVDRLAEGLKPPFFTKVTAGIPAQESGGELSILKYAPQILGEKDLQRIAGRLTTEGVSEQLRGIYLGAMKFESVFTNSLVRSDPIGVRQLIFEKLRALPASLGYDVSVEGGHFISRDGRHAMIIIETPVRMTQGKESAALIAALQEQIKGLPVFVTADIISGHVHAVSNEKVVKRDILIASTLVTVSFLVLFLLLFPDPRIAFVFLIPVIGIAVSINTVYFFLGSLSYLVIGIGTAIAGITVDHGLHMFIAVRRESTIDQIAGVSRLIVIDSLTTILGFSALFLSRVQGYHQLAFFAILCVSFSLLLSIFILPLLLFWKVPPIVRGRDWGERTVDALFSKRINVIVWSVLTVTMIVFSTGIQFESDVMRLDGSEPSVRETERRFYQTWGGESNQAVFVATGGTLEAALEVNDAIYRDATTAIGEKNITSLALLWPSEKTRKENLENWNRFWSEGREDSLRRALNEEAPKYGMRAEAFAPFFDDLHKNTVEAGSPDPLLEKIQERFVLKHMDEYRVLSYFPDDQVFVDALMSVSGRYPDSYIVSRKAVSKKVSAFTFGEVKFLVPVALLINIVVTWFFFGNIREMLIALVPLFTGIIWLTGFMALLDIPLDVVSIIGIVIVSGVIVDYGIGVTYEYQYNLKIGTIMAVSLSAVTTILGSGVLLFAKHPVMFSIGVGMTVSVLTGYLTSILVVPSLCDLLVKRRRREAK